MDDVPAIATALDRDDTKASFDLAVKCVAAFGAIALIGFLDWLQVRGGLDPSFVIASLGASAVLVFGAPESPLAQPRNVLGGHLISALIGVTCFKLFGAVPWLSGALAVALAIFAMACSKTTHPPGGATALIANIGSVEVKRLGFSFVFTPVLAGALVLVIVGFAARHVREKLPSE